MTGAFKNFTASVSPNENSKNLYVMIAEAAT